MENDIYFAILNRLAEAGLNQTADISDLVKRYYACTKDKDVWLFTKFAVNNYLQPMQDIKHLTFENNTTAESKTIDSINVTARILSEGLLFYYKKVGIDMTLSANKLSRKNIVITLLLAGLSLVISALSFWNSSRADHVHVNDMQQIERIKNQLSLQTVEMTKQNTLLHQEENRFLENLNKRKTGQNRTEPIANIYGYLTKRQPLK